MIDNNSLLQPNNRMIQIDRYTFRNSKRVNRSINAGANKTPFLVLIWRNRNRVQETSKQSFPSGTKVRRGSAIFSRDSCAVRCDQLKGRNELERGRNLVERRAKFGKRRAARFPRKGWTPEMESFSVRANGWLLAGAWKSSGRGRRLEIFRCEDFSEREKKLDGKEESALESSELWFNERCEKVFTPLME